MRIPRSIYERQLLCGDVEAPNPLFRRYIDKSAGEQLLFFHQREACDCFLGIVGCFVPRTGCQIVACQQAAHHMCIDFAFRSACITIQHTFGREQVLFNRGQYLAHRAARVVGLVRFVRSIIERHSLFVQIDVCARSIGSGGKRILENLYQEHIGVCTHSQSLSVTITQGFDGSVVRGTVHSIEVHQGDYVVGLSDDGVKGFPSAIRTTVIFQAEIQLIVVGVPVAFGLYHIFAHVVGSQENGSDAGIVVCFIA